MKMGHIHWQVRILLSETNQAKTFPLLPEAPIKDMLKQLKTKLHEKFQDALWLVIQANTGADGKSGNKLRTYALMKSSFKCEKYLVAPMPTKYKVCMARLRLSCHKLEIETGRYHKPYPKPAHERICRQCPSGRVEDEAHFLFSCEKYDTLRKRLYSDLQDINVTLNEHDPSALKIFDCDDTRVQLCLGRYIAMPTLKTLSLMNRQRPTTVHLHKHVNMFLSVLICKRAL